VSGGRAGESKRSCLLWPASPHPDSTTPHSALAPTQATLLPPLPQLSCPTMLPRQTSTTQFASGWPTMPGLGWALFTFMMMVVSRPCAPSWQISLRQVGTALSCIVDHTASGPLPVTPAARIVCCLPRYLAARIDMATWQCGFTASYTTLSLVPAGAVRYRLLHGLLAPGQRQQLAAFNHCLHRFGANHTWMGGCAQGVGRWGLHWEGISASAQCWC